MDWHIFPLICRVLVLNLLSKEIAGKDRRLGDVHIPLADVNFTQSSRIVYDLADLVSWQIVFPLTECLLSLLSVALWRVQLKAFYSLFWYTLDGNFPLLRNGFIKSYVILTAVDSALKILEKLTKTRQPNFFL